jgi:hypothetical protein
MPRYAVGEIVINTINDRRAKIAIAVIPGDLHASIAYVDDNAKEIVAVGSIRPVAAAAPVAPGPGMATAGVAPPKLVPAAKPTNKWPSIRWQGVSSVMGTVTPTTDRSQLTLLWTGLSVERANGGKDRLTNESVTVLVPSKAAVARKARIDIRGGVSIPDIGLPQKITLTVAVGKNVSTYPLGDGPVDITVVALLSGADETELRIKLELDIGDKRTVQATIDSAELSFI